MAKVLNVSEIIREYLLFKSVFDDEKVKRYKEELRNAKNESRHDLISIYEKFIENVGKIQVPSLANPKKMVSLDVYLNDLKKTYIVNHNEKLRPDRYLEFGNQVDTMINDVPGAQASLLKALEDANYAEITRKFKLSVGKTGGKQTFSIANEILSVAGMSGKNTHITSLKKQINKLEEELEKARQDNSVTNYLTNEITKLRLKLNEEIKNQVQLVRTIAADNNKSLQNIELTLTGVSDTVKQNNKILNKLVRFKPVRDILLIVIAVLAAAGLTINIVDLAKADPAPIVENLPDEYLNMIDAYLKDGQFTTEEAASVKNYINLEVKDKNEQNKYIGIVDNLLEGSKLQGIKENIVDLAIAFGVDKDIFTEAEIENKIVNDPAYRADVIDYISKYAKYANYDQIQEIVNSVGDKLGITPKAETESYKDFKDRVIGAIGDIQSENTILSAENVKLESINDGLLKRVVDLSKNVQDNTKEIAGLKKVIENLDTTIESLKAQIDTLTNSSNNSETIKLLQEQLAEAQKGKAEAEKVLAEKEVEFNAKVAELENTISELNNQIKLRDSKIDELEAQVKDLEAKLANAATPEQVEKLNEEIKKLNEQIITLENENIVLEDTLETTKQELADANAKIADLNSQIQDANDTIESLKNEVNSLKDQINNNQSVSKETYDKLLNDYNNLASLYDGLQKSYNEKVQELADLYNKYEGAVTAEEAQALMNKIQKLESDLADALLALEGMDETYSYMVFNLNNLAKKFGMTGLSPQEVLDVLLSKYGITPAYPETGDNADEKQPS